MPTDVVLPAVAPSTILVVDDSATNLQVLVRTLDGTGHRILAARDGATALEIARRVKPDLMLLDVMMPGLDGFEVCRIIKADAETRDTAVIFLSARGEVSDKVSGLQLGAADYITKPIQGEEVLARVATHLSRQHLERALRLNRDRLDRELASAARMQRLILPAAHARASQGRFRGVLRDEPACRRRLLRRAPARRRSVRHHGGRRVRPRRARRDRHGDDSRGRPHLSARGRRPAGRAASHQPSFPVPLGYLLARDGARSPAEIVDRLVADLNVFAGGHEPDDDQTLLIAGVG